WDFGTGALGDMACHTANLAFMALRLKYPTSIVAETVVGLNPQTYPTGARIAYQFPGRGDLPPVKLYWYEGKQDGKLLQPPESVLKNYKQPDKGYTVLFKDGLVMVRNNDGKEHHIGSGCFIVGDKAVLFSPSDYGSESYILTGSGIQKVTGKPEKMPSSPGHHKEWIEACKGGPAAVSNFNYAGLLTETVLLGNVAIRAGQGKKVAWNGDKLTTGNAETDAFLRMPYRKGWTL
ncbi:MAG TPA: gfo/Idh/MocA family oxidoreductase, partial [Gemmataceae bacterium]|nr:gfo/Idh/MocA family oxidoreductase [Gemmataceae bacterium]